MKFHEARQENGGMEVGLMEDLNDFRADMSDGCVSDCAVNVRLMKRKRRRNILSNDFVRIYILYPNLCQKYY